jgi:hypothetical protein
MIKLTVNLGLQPDVKLFNKSTVIIGSDVPAISDLALPGESLCPIHVKIQEQGGSFIIINQANDPFVTLNGLPFGKKTIKNNDLIQIGDTTINFYGETSSPNNQGPLSNKPLHMQAMVPTDKLNDILEEALNNHRLMAKNASPQNVLKTNIDAETESELLEKNADELLAEKTWDLDKMDEKDLQDLLQQVDELEDYQQTESMPSEEAPTFTREQQDSIISKNDLEHQPETTSFTPLSQKQKPMEIPSTKNKRSLKDAYLSEFDDENQAWNQNKTSLKKEMSLIEKWNWKLIGIVMILIFILSTIFGIFFYVKIAASNSKDEIKAAESIADVAMALTFAQVHHIKPQNQNWSDPDFLKNNLIAVLSSDSTPLAELDGHGQFSNLSYFLRVYTSNDLSQFFIIAQPAPSLLQWFVPKASIIVHSKTMELRKTSDLKAINRLLLNPTTLDGMSANELSHLVKQGDIIPLTTLAVENPGDFTPPTTLALIRPGAENLIYNAPRYYHFGEGFLKKAQMLANNFGNSDYEFTFFQEELQELARYPDIVLYTSYGMQWARQAQKQMNLFSPNNKILIASLKLNPKGLIASTQLLMDGDSPSDVAIIEAESKESQQASSLTKESESQLGGNDIDSLNPLYAKLRSLAIEYKNAMQPIDQEFKALLESSNLDDNIALLDRLHKLLIKNENNYQNDLEKLKKNKAALAFIDKLQTLLKNYRGISQQEDEKLSQELSILYQDFPSIPVSQFISYLKATGFADHVQEHLKLHEKSIANHAMTETQITDLLKKIQKAISLEGLSINVKELSTLLNLGNVPDTQKLLTYQNSARVQTLEKLNDFLLSSDKALPEQEFITENRPLMANILKDAWVVDPDEFDFYLNEFDLRLQNGETENTQSNQALF